MSAHDDFSLHDDEELSLHDDASLAGSLPASNKGDAPAKPPQIITTNTLSNIKLPLEALGAGVTDEDANHKFLRSLPPAWDSLAMTMRTKKNIDTLSVIKLMTWTGRDGYKLADCYDCHQDQEVLQENRQKAKSGWKNACGI
ncbi:hypothetical protein Tco_1192233 [Tanacetum coccineum]